MLRKSGAELLQLLSRIRRKGIRVKNLTAFAVLVAVACVAGCSSSPPPPSISVAVSPQPAYVSSGQVIQFTATVQNDTSGVSWSVNGIPGGNATVGMIDSLGNFTAPNLTQNGSSTITATSKKDSTKSASATATIIAPGTVTSTPNPQVAQYSITAPAGVTVLVQFGPDTGYGLNTWALSPPTGGGAISILVAGMRANSTYHMRAQFQANSQTVFNDSDHTFTTGAYQLVGLPTITTSTTPGMTPQSGVELLNLSALDGVVVLNLSGNILWDYLPVIAGATPAPAKLLPNGHFLVNFLVGNQVNGANSLMQEVDLTGQVVWQMTAAQLNAALAAATCAGCNITVLGTHHDFAILPDGHLILLASTQETISGTVVTGDVLIDLDQNHNPVWLWNEFDHLDVNRHPMNWPDWTHSNAVVYSPSDHDLIVSIRHQSWVVKIDYNDGQGTGNILWRLGYQGDFTLQNGTDPVDWFSAQHDANVISSNSSGVFQMTLFDNGNQRVLDSSGTLCSSTTTPCDSRVPILQLDENAKTAAIEWVDKLAPVFSFFGGNSRLLANGDVEFDECAANSSPTSAAIYEVTKTTPPQTVWQMQIAGQYIYRGFRIPSLYPGVQW
jgi:arylsulfate sulfotransferase